MRPIEHLSLLALAGLASADARDIFFTPMIESTLPQVVEGCDASGRSDAFFHPMLRPLTGLNAYGKKLLEINETLPNGVSIPVDVTACAVRALRRAQRKEEILSIAKALCQCGNSQQYEQICRGFSDMFKESICLSQYQPPASVCESLKPENDYGWTVSQQCRLPTAGSISALDLPLYDLRYSGNVPPVVPADYAKTEGRTYYFAWKAIEKLMRIHDAVVTCKFAATDSELVPGWVPKLTLHAQEEGATHPTIHVAERLGNFMITVRSAATTTEGYLAALSQATYTNRTGFPGETVSGAAAMTQAFMPALQFFFKSYYLKALTDPRKLIHPRIFITGAGQFGASVAAILAVEIALMAEQLPTTNQANLIRTDLVVFGSGRVGNSEFVNFLGRRVNIRSIQISGDSTAEFPCESMPTCSEFDSVVRTRLEGGFRTTGLKLPGALEVSQKQLLALSGADNTTASWASPAAPFEIAAQSVCATNCFLSREYCPDELFSMCTAKECPAMFSLA